MHVVPGEVPLLISKRFLKNCWARVKLDSSELYFSKIGVKLKIIEKSDGLSQLNLLDVGPSGTVSTPEVDGIHIDAAACPRMEAKVLMAEKKKEIIMNMMMRFAFSMPGPIVSQGA